MYKVLTAYREVKRGIQYASIGFLAFFVCVSPTFAYRAVIHHSDSPDVSASIIDEWHKAQGWDEIGYHFVIHKDGSVEPGRSLEKPGAHALGRNHLIGICLTGRDMFTAAQVETLVHLCRQYGITCLEPHHEKCPGPGLCLRRINERLLR